MPQPKSTLTAAEEAIRLATRGFGNMPKTASGSIADRMLRESAGFTDPMGGKLRSTVTAADEAMRLATGGLGKASGSITGSLMDKAARDAADKHSAIFARMSEGERLLASGGILGRNQKLIDAAMGRTGSFGRAIDEMTTLRGVSATAVGGLKDRLGTFETASEHLRKELDTSLARDPHRFTDEHLRMPPLPPMPRNPIYETNKLLDRMNQELVEQRTLIEASADAQKRETELLATLVEAFAANQIASDKSTRRSHLQAWIGIGIALLTLAITPFLG